MNHPGTHHKPNPKILSIMSPPRGGEYSIDVELARSGTADNPITYESFPGELAIFDGSQIPPGTDEQLVISASWNILRNIEVRDSPMRGILVLGDNNVIENVRIHGSHLVGLQFFEAAGNHALNIVSFDNYDPQNGGGDADGIQALDSHDTTIIGCRVYENSDDGVDTFQSFNTIIDRCISYHNGRDNGDGDGFKLGGGDGDSGAATVTNSISFDNLRRGFSDNGANLPSTLLNNTAARNSVNYQFMNARNRLANNISFDGELLLDNNELQNNSWNLAINDPLFISLDPDSPDFLRLQPNSPAIDAGVDVGLPFSGLAPDLGADINPALF